MRSTSALFGISHFPGMKENNYCGPAALSALTGLSCEFIAQAIKDGRDNNRPIATTCLSEMSDLLHGLNCDTKEIIQARGLTLKQFDEDLVENLGHPVLIYVSNHFIVCDPYEATYYDNTTDAPAFIDEFPSPRRKIKHAYSVRRNFSLFDLHQMEKDWSVGQDTLE